MDFDADFTDDTRFVHCEICERKFDLDEMSEYELTPDDYMCPNCYEDRTVKCAECGCDVWFEDALAYKDGYICTSCYGDLPKEEEDESE